MNLYAERITHATINDKKLAGLKFGQSTNKSAWQKKVWQVHPEL